MICKIENCTNKVLARGWCNKHYLRWQNFGDPLKERKQEDFRFGNKKEIVCYGQAHARLGKASEKECSCGQQAYDWAQLVQCPETIIDEKGRSYCLHWYHYEAMCRSCHNTMDRANSGIS